MFLSREEKEERKRQEKKKVDTEDKIEELEELLDQQKEKANKIINADISHTGGRWEYLELEVKFDLFSDKDELNDRGGLEELGDDGWELASILPRVSVVSGNGGTNSATYYFKRRIVPLSKDAEIELGKIDEERTRLQDEIDQLSKELEQME